MSNENKKTKLAASLWCFFLGMFGAHWFYVGKVGIGVLHFLTLGALGIWTLIDFIRILVGNFEDGDGNKLTYWR